MAKRPGLLDSLKSALLEDDASGTPAAEPAASPPPQPAQSGFAFGLGAPAVAPAPASPVTRPAPDALDPAAVQEVEKRVYVDFSGKPSRFLKFVQMWHKLGQPKDVSTVIGALQVFDASITKEAISEDLVGHFKLLDNAAAQATAEVDAAAKEMVGGAEGEIEQLQKECAAAEEEVKRINEAQRGRIERITRLTQQANESRAKIERAYRKTEAATVKVRADLTTLQQLLTSP